MLRLATTKPDAPPTWYEFFCGGGMARLGLGPGWRCVFSNDICPKKAAAYRAYFGGEALRICDVAALTTADLPGHATLAWASFPCQDLSLAGNGAGLEGARSGSFLPFWRLVTQLAAENRAPETVVLENVTGALTARGGADFTTLLSALDQGGYRAGCLIIDAARFLPQSRPRLFVIGVRRVAAIPAHLLQPEPSDPWHPAALRRVHERLPQRLRERWLWWQLPQSTRPVTPLTVLIDDDAMGVSWHTPAQTGRLIELMGPMQLAKLARAQGLRERIVGTVYKRTRTGPNGVGRQAAEVRFDQTAGCLRTPTGGSSRQTILLVNGNSVRSRLLSAREAARLMGVSEDYPLPARYNDAYHVFGDGLAVPVVTWLSRHLLTPLAVQ
jgi:DNA (cytosine-5)-methyltransferase 1